MTVCSLGHSGKAGGGVRGRIIAVIMGSIRDWLTGHVPDGPPLFVYVRINK